MPTFVGEPPGVPRRIWGRRRPSRLDPSHPIIGRNQSDDIARVDFAQSSPTFHRARARLRPSLLRSPPARTEARPPFPERRISPRAGYNSLPPPTFTPFDAEPTLASIRQATLPPDEERDPPLNATPFDPRSVRTPGDTIDTGMDGCTRPAGARARLMTSLGSGAAGISRHSQPATHFFLSRIVV